MSTLEYDRRGNQFFTKDGQLLPIGHDEAGELRVYARDPGTGEPCGATKEQLALAKQIVRQMQEQV